MRLGFEGVVGFDFTYQGRRAGLGRIAWSAWSSAGAELTAGADLFATNFSEWGGPSFDLVDWVLGAALYCSLFYFQINDYSFFLVLRKLFRP